MSDATVRRVASFDKEHRISDGPRRVPPCTLPIPKFVWQPKGSKPRNAWSGPRGYDSTIREEAAAFKAAMRRQRQEEEKATVKPIKRSQVAPLPLQEPKPKPDPKREWVPKVKLAGLRNGCLRLMGNIFCMRVEIESYIVSRRKVDMAEGET